MVILQEQQRLTVFEMVLVSNLGETTLGGSGDGFAALSLVFSS